MELGDEIEDKRYLFEVSNLKNLRSIEWDTSENFMNLLIKKQIEVVDVDQFSMPHIVHEQDGCANWE